MARGASGKSGRDPPPVVDTGMHPAHKQFCDNQSITKRKFMHVICASFRRLFHCMGSNTTPCMHAPCHAVKLPDGCLFAFCMQGHMSDARPGDHAYIHSMQKNTDKDTRKCELLCFDATRARWEVRIIAPPQQGAGEMLHTCMVEVKTFWVKPSNLFPVLWTDARVLVHGVGGAMNNQNGRITGRNFSTDQWSVTTKMGDTVISRACHIYPEVNIGSVVSIITPQFPWYHRREATIIGYDIESKLWKILMECDTDNKGSPVPYNLYEYQMPDEYVVPYHRFGDMVVLDREDNAILQGQLVQLHNMTGETAGEHRWTIKFQGQTLVRTAFQLRSAGEDESRSRHLPHV